MIQRRSSMSVAVLEHNGKSHVYVIGGELLGETLTSVELYCPKQNIWSCIPSMKFPRQNPGVGVLNQRIYVLGGDSDSNKSLNYVECYDPNTSVWTTVKFLALIKANILMFVIFSIRLWPDQQ